MSEGGVARLGLPVGERDHVQGPASAPVTLVEYGDYECPYCRAAVPIVQELQRLLGDQLRFVFRHFPLTGSHPHAQHAAEVAEAAAAQGRFSEMHGALFEHQEALEDDHLVQYAADLELDTAGFVVSWMRTPMRAGSVKTSRAASAAACGERPPSTLTRSGTTGSLVCASSWRRSRARTPTSSSRSRKSGSDNARFHG